ncbi:MAG: hypothetical protein ACK5X3_16960 [Pseudomonadota bacterium]|jgi:hypothetical protein
MKGRTKWFPRHVRPVRPGFYECGVRITSMQRSLMLCRLEWDGVGFLVPCPMAVHQWRGMTKKAAKKARRANSGGGNG